MNKQRTCANVKKKTNNSTTLTSGNMLKSYHSTQKVYCWKNVSILLKMEKISIPLACLQFLFHFVLMIQFWNTWQWCVTCSFWTTVLLLVCCLCCAGIIGHRLSSPWMDFSFELADYTTQSQISTVESIQTYNVRQKGGMVLFLTSHSEAVAL